MAFEWKDITSIVGNIAPILGTALGGPAGGAVGGLIANLLGVDNEPNAIAGAIKADPNIAVKLKELELKAQELHYDAINKERQAELDELKAYIGDIQSARSRQVEHEKAVGGSDINFYVLAWVIVLGFFGLMATLMFVEIPIKQTEVMFMLFGTLSAGFGAVIQYFFGSSKGSADKAEHIARLKDGAK